MDISLFTIDFIVFVMASFVGYHVIWGVTPALHTPLMSVTNAISGVVLVGAMFVAGTTFAGTPTAEFFGFNVEIAKLIGFFAVFFASVNVFGGFAVTHRMLSMFKVKKKGDK